MADPSESFVSSFNHGLNMAMQMDNIRTQQQIRNFQMQELALKLQEQQQEQAFMTNLKDNPQARSAYKSMHAQELHPLIDYGIDMGVPNLLKGIPKLPPVEPTKVVDNKIVERRGPGKWESVYDGGQKLKEFNAPADVDTFLMGRYPKYATDANERTKAFEWYGTPEGQKEFNSWWSRREIVRRPATQIIQTPEGQGTVDLRTKRFKALGIKRQLSQQEADELATLDSINESIKKVKGLYSDKYVGPISGRIGGIESATGIGTDSQEQAFRAANAELEKTLFDLGGKQLTANEIKVLKPFIPNTNDPAVTYRMKVKNFEQKYTDILKKKVQRLNQSGYGLSTKTTKVGRFTVEEE